MNNKLFLIEQLLNIVEDIIMEKEAKTIDEWAKELSGSGYTYLIHFEKPYKHAQHYIGWTENLEQRLVCHQSGTGARLMEVVTGAGIDWVLATYWENTSRHFERKLKSMKNASFYCPVCKYGRPDDKAINFCGYSLR